SGDTNGFADEFVRDRGTGLTERVSVDAAGAQANGSSFEAAISEDGSVIIFESAATNLVPGDTNGVSDVFVRVQTIPTTTTTLVPPTTTTSSPTTSTTVPVGSSTTVSPSSTTSSTTTTLPPDAVEGFILPKRVSFRPNARRPAASVLIVAG